SGIILMVERSIKIGDYIEVDKDTRGRVTDIRMRSIVLNTGSNIDITVPNQRLVENRVINWSMNDKIRKFEIPFSVAYGTSPDEVIKIVLDAVESFDGCSSLIKSGKRSSKVVMTNMGESSIDFELFIWIEGESIFASKSVTSKFLILIYETLNRRGIEIPFPQQDVNIRSFKMVSEID
ncbi:MAG: mechanosensitive ion channel, partial [Epsilonproteobacteria bacterium]|nr:mechanosensitive ion channel [Campylobacterota bacterium]